MDPTTGTSWLGFGWFWALYPIEDRATFCKLVLVTVSNIPHLIIKPQLYQGECDIPDLRIRPVLCRFIKTEGKLGDARKEGE